MHFQRKRIFTLYLFFFVSFLFLLGRICYIQLIDGPRLAQKAIGQRLRTINYIQFPRGDILDRYGRPLTNTLPQLCIVVFPVLVQDSPETVKLLAETLNMSAETVSQKIGNVKHENNLKIVKSPFILKANASHTQVERIRKAELPGVYILPLVTRYKTDWPAVHLLGYVGEPGSEDEVSVPSTEGKTGIEKQYDSFLSGGASEKVAILIDDRGRALSGRGFTLLPAKERAVKEMHGIELTIDYRYQQAVEKALGDKSGAVVVMDVNTGDILAMASSPKFDPYMLEKPISGDAYVNKALQSYPPASVFKIVLAVALMEEGLAHPDDMFTCTGKFSVPGGHEVSCWFHEGHGDISFAESLAHSCNSVFIENGLKIGGALIQEYADRLGLLENRIIGLSVPQVNRLFFNYTIPGDIANVSIGENGVRLSPVTVARLISEVANGGLGVIPRVVSRIRDEEGKIIEEYVPDTQFRVISASTAKELKIMLRDAVQEGTGKTAQVLGISTAGKTGSSETEGAWFAGFAPFDSPRWAVAVFIHKGNSGAGDAAPVFQNIVSQLVDLEKLK
ncbi:MAG: penicillin-binding transpeptidase domain-containing protein [Desulfitobacteriaceae bacterium]|nr:penicillin-binding transpeptidase domain-containing protein [Desulfitobacteriaceae bacterium]